MNGGSVTSTSAFGESFSIVARFTTSPLPAITILTFTPSFFSKAGNTSLYRFSRPSALYSTTASAAKAGTVTTLAKAATASAGNTRCATKREAGKRVFVMVLVSPGRRIQPGGVRVNGRFDTFFPGIGRILLDPMRPMIHWRGAPNVGPPAARTKHHRTS